MYHLIAIFTVIVWGATFISTKVLMSAGLTPIEVMFYRFAIAYISILPFTYKRLFAASLKDEGTMLLIGLSGGSLYFLAENYALSYTLASNVSLIICTTPILTALLDRFFGSRKPLTPHFLLGSTIAFIGIAFVIFNGSIVLGLNPIGDILTLTAAFLWGIFSLTLKKVQSHYKSLFITRKTFFYSVLSLLPFILFSPGHTSLSTLLRPIMLSNLLFLGLLASTLCFFLWNVAVKAIGPVSATNYIYLSPIVTLIVAHYVLDEPITAMAIFGSFFILVGVFLALRKQKSFA